MGGTCFVIIELILGRRQKSKSAKSEGFNIGAITSNLEDRTYFYWSVSVQKLYTKKSTHEGHPSGTFVSTID